MLWDKAMLRGDFNEIVSNAEKNVRSIRLQSSMLIFGISFMMLFAEFENLGFFLGDMITWNNRGAESNVQQRSDRCLDTILQCRSFPQLSVHHLDATSLDHKAWL